MDKIKTFILEHVFAWEILSGHFYCFVGSFNIPSLSIPRKAGSSMWGIPNGRDEFLASDDASLFSSSLPVLRHEKCMYELFLLDVMDSYP